MAEFLPDGLGKFRIMFTPGTISKKFRQSFRVVSQEGEKASPKAPPGRVHESVANQHREESFDFIQVGHLKWSWSEPGVHAKEVVEYSLQVEMSLIQGGVEAGKLLYNLFDGPGGKEIHEIGLM